jgi:hypothetical protein
MKAQRQGHLGAGGEEIVHNDKFFMSAATYMCSRTPQR